MTNPNDDDSAADTPAWSGGVPEPPRDEGSTGTPDIPGFTDWEFLGEGGMGVVWKARQVAPSRAVAVKLVRPAHLLGRVVRQRFNREILITSRLAHPNVVSVYSVGTHAGVPYYVMELADGESLDKQLTARRATAREAVEIVVRLAQTLVYTHAKGIVHRDLKPSNVLRDERGELKIADFGLASTRDSESSVALTTGPLGTLQYMAPEQMAVEFAEVGSAADVYSLGVIFYELLTGTRPHSEPTAERLQQSVLHKQPDAPSRLLLPSASGFSKRDLDTVCLAMLAKAPADRPSAELVASDLTRLLGMQPITLRAPSPAERLVRWARREPIAASMAATITALIAAVCVVTTTMSLKLRASNRSLESSNLELVSARDAAESSREAAERSLAASDALRERLVAQLTAQLIDKPSVADGGVVTSNALGRGLDGTIARLDALSQAEDERADVDASVVDTLLTVLESLPEGIALRPSNQLARAWAYWRKKGDGHAERHAKIETICKKVLARPTGELTEGERLEANFLLGIVYSCSVTRRDPTLAVKHLGFVVGQLERPSAEAAAALAFDTYFWHGYDAGELEEAETAIESLQRALEIRPTSGPARSVLAMELRTAGEYDKMLSVCKSDPEVTKKVYELLLRAAEVTPNWVLLRAANDLVEVFPDLTESLCSKVLETDEENPLAFQLLGRVHLDRGEHKKALDALVSSHQRDADDAHVMALLAEAHYRLGESDASQEWINRSQEAARSDVDNARSVGFVLNRIGQHERAAETLRALLAERPNDAIAHNNLGYALLLLEEHDEAALACAEAVRIEPGNPRFRIGLIRAQHAAGDEAAARESIESALGETTMTAAQYIRVGFILNGLGQHERAIAVLEKALKRRPGDNVALNNLGFAHQRSGRPTEAARFYTSSLTRDPTYEKAKDNLVDLLKSAQDDPDYHEIAGRVLVWLRDAALSDEDARAVTEAIGDVSGQ